MNSRDLNEAARILSGVSRSLPIIHGHLANWAMLCKNEAYAGGVEALRSVRANLQKRWGWCNIRRGLNDLGNAYVAVGDVSNAIDTLREAAKFSRW